MRLRVSGTTVAALLWSLLWSCSAASAQPIADPAFDASVAEPHYRDTHPRVVVDEAHFNYHTVSGRYLPFAALMRNDGYDVVAGTGKFTREFLARVDVLVIANARGAAAPPRVTDDAFTAEECAAVDEWVKAGGRLLLIADHQPFGRAAQSLALRFGVRMGFGHVFDTVQSVYDPTFISFTRENGLLRDHAITRGRHAREMIRQVVTFDGQSLEVPAGAVALLVLGPDARESDNAQQLEAGTGRPVGGRAQGIALSHGRGRIVVMAEAAMFSAQIYRPGAPGQGSGPDPGEIRFGMNVPGNDDRQFVLNVMHWLSGAL